MAQRLTDDKVFQWVNNVFCLLFIDFQNSEKHVI